MKKLYIITGANGFLGNNIIRKLEQNIENEIKTKNHHISVMVLAPFAGLEPATL